MVRRRLVALFSIVLLVLAGCSNWGEASGTATLDGQPLKEGVVTFHRVGGGPTAYGTVQNGAFQIATAQRPGLAAGEYKVTIWASTIPKEGTNETAKMLTPVKYAKPETSDLKAEVKAGSNSFTFDLKSK